MSAPAHATNGFTPPVLTLPRTLQAVRSALTDDERAVFAGEMETGDVIAVFNRWWNIAAMRTSPDVAAAVDRYRRGGWMPVTLEQAMAGLSRSA